MTPAFFRKRQKRVFVLALDGVPYSLAERFVREGRMPKLAAVIGDGRLIRMHSCYPTVSNVAWACFQTGKNPGRFGIFGFAELTREMELYVPDCSHLRSRTLWDILSEAGRRVIALGVPLTYPPRPVNGIVVGGFLAPGLQRAVYPPEMLDEVRSCGYRLDVDPVKARESLDYLKDDLLQCLAGRARTLAKLWGSQRWDLFVVHVMESDRINHFMWKFLDDRETANGAFFMDFYQRIDDLIGNVADQMDDRTELMILSDHGFCETRKEVQVNRWLEQNGYLAYEEGASRGYQSLCGSSRAVALVPGRIHILRKGKWKNGSVHENQYEALRDRLVDELRDWTDQEDGQHICQHVFRREEIFQGPCVEQAPDIVVHPNDGYDLKAALGQEGLFTSTPINGMHTQHDAMLFLRGHHLRDDTPTIWDVTPTLLRLLNVDPPEDMDGRSLV